MVLDSTVIDLLTEGRVEDAKNRLMADYIQIDRDLEASHRDMFGDNHDRLWAMMCMPPGGARLWREHLITQQGELSQDGREEALKLPLSPDRAHLLRQFLAPSGTIDLLPYEIKWLQTAGLVNNNLQLTAHGRLRTVEQLPLDQQCAFLAIPLREDSMPSGVGKVERRYVKSLLDNGCPAIFDDDPPLLWLISSFSYDYFQQTSRKHGNTTAVSYNSLSSALTCFPENFRVNKAAAATLRHIARKTSKDDLLRQLDVTCASSAKARGFQSFLKAVVCETSLQTLQDLFILCTENAMAYRHGWPDVTFIHDKRLRFSEIKVGDKLHINQLRLLPELHRITQSVEVVRLHRSPKR